MKRAKIVLNSPKMSLMDLINSIGKESLNRRIFRIENKYKRLNGRMSASDFEKSLAENIFLK